MQNNDFKFESMYVNNSSALDHVIVQPSIKIEYPWGGQRPILTFAEFLLKECEISSFITNDSYSIEFFFYHYRYIHIDFFFSISFVCIFR